MGGEQVFVEIIIFAMIAVFLVYRLRSVLGRRNGDERQRPNPYTPPPAAGTEAVNVPAPAEQPEPVDIYQPGDQRPLAAWLDAIRRADPSFDEKVFVSGSRAAFAMIVEAFSRGDRAALRPLLSDSVFEGFSGAIGAREKSGETLETRIERFQDADVVDARLDGSTAFLTVRFVTDQVNVTRDASGAVTEGDAEKAEEVIDLWTFSRDTRSRNPNWVLVETRTPQ
jgi:predicted lipid-binding transport protein (Tim44 family)